MSIGSFQAVKLVAQDVSELSFSFSLCLGSSCVKWGLRYFPDSPGVVMTNSLKTVKHSYYTDGGPHECLKRDFFPVYTIAPGKISIDTAGPLMFLLALEEN